LQERWVVGAEVEEVGRGRLRMAVQVVLGTTHLLVAGAEEEHAAAVARGACGEHRDLLRNALNRQPRQTGGRKRRAARRKALLMPTLLSVGLTMKWDGRSLTRR
jgi:hypothetical protein